MNSDSKDIQIKIQKFVPGKKWKVLRLISRVQYFPNYMPNVKQCTIIDKGENFAITSWNVEVEGIPLSWRERDTYDIKNFTVSFEAIEGDLNQFKGKWILSDAPQGTMVTVEVSARIDIPILADIVGGIVLDKLKKNFEIMLSAMSEMLTTQRYKNIRDRKTSDLSGFAVIGHPYNFQHLVRYFKFFDPQLKLPSQEFLSKIFELTPSYKSYDVHNFRSKTGKEVNGYFVMCPIIPDMLAMSPERVVEKVIQACKVSEQLGVGVVVLGGFTSIAGEKFAKSMTTEVNVPITTGNTLTVAMVLDGLHKAAEVMEVDLSKAKVTIIGGTGDIGGAVARILSEEVAEITITSRSDKNLMEAERVLSYYGKAKIRTSKNNNEAVKGADIILAAASVSSSILEFSSFKPGAIICDVGYPKNISYTKCDRKDILVFSGGITSLPTEFNLGFDVGMPSSKVLYGCFAEAIVLALEERFENFSWGKGNINKDRIDLIKKIASKHGFEVAPFFWGNKLLTEQDLEHIKENARISILKQSG